MRAMLLPKTVRPAPGRRSAPPVGAATMLPGRGYHPILFFRRSGHRTELLSREDPKFARDERHGRPRRDRTLRCASRGLVGPRRQFPVTAPAQPHSTRLSSSTFGGAFPSQFLLAAT